MRYLNFMTRTDGSPIVYLLKALGLTLAGTALIILVQSSLFPLPENTIPDETPTLSAFEMLILWPIMSTLVLWPVLAVCKRVTPTYWHAAAIAAFAFAALFGLSSGFEAAAIFVWPYFIYSLTFLAWQLKSEFHAIIMTSLLQAGFNLLPTLITA